MISHIRSRIQGAARFFSSESSIRYLTWNLKTTCSIHVPIKFHWVLTYYTVNTHDTRNFVDKVDFCHRNPSLTFKTIVSFALEKNQTAFWFQMKNSSFQVVSCLTEIFLPVSVAKYLQHYMVANNPNGISSALLETTEVFILVFMISEQCHIWQFDFNPWIICSPLYCQYWNERNSSA